MKTKYFLFLVLFISLLSSCVYTSNSSSEKTVYLTSLGFDSSKELKLTIIEGATKKINSSSSKIIYKVNFKSVRGGTSYFLGITWKDVNGDTYPRLSIIESKNILKKLSLNEILSMEYEVIDGLRIYKIDLSE